MPPSEPTYQLRETVEAFPASDGRIYFLRGAERAEHVLRHPSAGERALLHALHEPTPRSALQAAMRAAAADDTDLDPALGQLIALGLVDEVDPTAPESCAPDRERYDRQVAYFADACGDVELAWAHQERLGRARAVIVGCGGLGTWAAAGLACAGVGELVLVDDDTVALSNLNRQILYRPTDIGSPKVDLARRELRAFDPQLSVVALRRRIASVADARAVVAGADIVVATADDPPYEIARWVNDACVPLGIPWTSAGQFPPRLRVGPLVRTPQTGCWACQEAAARRDFPLYDELVAYRQRRRIKAATLGPASGIAGSLLAMDAVYCLTGLHPPATQGRSMLLDLRTLGWQVEELPRDPACPVCSRGGEPPDG